MTSEAAGNTTFIRQCSEGLVDAWRSAALRSDPPTAFLGPTFARAVGSVRSGVAVCEIQFSECLPAYFPFQYRPAFGRALGIAERVGGEMSDACGIVARQPVALSVQELLRHAGLCSFNFSHLPEEQLAHGLTGEQPRRGLMIDLAGGGDAFWEERRRIDVKFVRDTERRERKLAQECGPLRFQMSASQGEAELQHLIDRKRRQYARTGVGDGLAEPWKRELLARLLASHEADCSGLLSVLYAGDTWVASHFGLVCGQVLHYWFPVYNDELSRFGPGRLLLRRIIDGASGCGITLIDRGEGDSPAKRDFANRERLYYRGHWTLGLSGSLAKVGYAMAWRLPRRGGVAGSDRNAS